MNKIAVVFTYRNAQQLTDHDHVYLGCRDPYHI